MDVGVVGGVAVDEAVGVIVVVIGEAFGVDLGVVVGTVAAAGVHPEVVVGVAVDGETVVVALT